MLCCGLPYSLRQRTFLQLHFSFRGTRFPAFGGSLSTHTLRFALTELVPTTSLRFARTESLPTTSLRFALTGAVFFKLLEAVTGEAFKRYLRRPDKREERKDRDDCVAVRLTS